MDAYGLGVALAALIVAVTALVRTAVRDRSDAPLDAPESAGRPLAVVRLLRASGPPPSRLTRAVERLLPIVPKACALSAVAVVVATFALQNRHAVSVHFLDWHFDRVPLALAIGAAAVVAGSGAALVALAERRGLQRRIRQLERLRRPAGASWNHSSQGRDRARVSGPRWRPGSRRSPGDMAPGRM